MTKTVRAACLLAGLTAAATSFGFTIDYAEWKSVQIGASGFVTGIIAHPKQPNLFYIRTDAGGCYRWSASENRWVFLLDQFGWDAESNYWQVEAIAFDPSDTNTVYIFAGDSYIPGNHPPGDVFKSTDRGRTWTSCNFKKYAYGNGDWRWVGERMAVDPFNGNIVYVGTRKDGLWRSENGGASWSKVSAIPDGDTWNHGMGISFVVFDTNAGRISGRCRVIYVGVMNSSGDVYRSVDGGTTWSVVDDGGLSGAYPVRAAIAKGVLYVTYADNDSPFNDYWGKIYRCDSHTSSLVDKTPGAGLAMSGIAVNPHNPQQVFATAYPADAKWYDMLFLSSDGGNSWQAFGKRWQGTDNYYDERPWEQNTSVPAWAASCVFDPYNPSRVFVSDGFQVWVCDNIWGGTPRTWNTRIKDIEELVAFGALSVPGKGWFTYVGDKSGFRHSQGLDNYPAAGDWWNFNGGDFPYVGGTLTMDFCEANPNVVVRSGTVPFGSGGWRNGSDPYAKKSTDGGVTWSPMNRALRGAGTIAVSATDPNRMVWVPMPDSNDSGNGGTWYSTDGGNTWNWASGGPINAHWDIWSTRSALASDRVNGMKFYALGEVNQWDYQINGKFFRSTDGGQTWSQTWDFGIDSYTTHKFVNVKAAPGMEGEVWVGLGPHGLFRSSDSGSSFTKINAVNECRSFGFGKPKPGNSHPTIFVIGRVEGSDGIFRSDDMGASWVKVVEKNQSGLIGDGQITGDRDVYGQFVVATFGRGFMYGKIAAAASSRLRITHKSVTPTLLTNNLPRLTVFRVSTRSSNCTVTNVSLNLSAIGGPSALKLTNLAGTTQWRYGYTVPAWTVPGTYDLPLTVRADNGRFTNTVITLHIVAPANRIGFVYLTATPSLVTNIAAKVVVFRVHVRSTNGTVTNVSLDLSALGGPSSARMTNISAPTLWRYAYTVPAGTPVGVKTVPAVAVDNNRNRKTNTSLTVQVVTAPAPLQKFLLIHDGWGVRGVPERVTVQAIDTLNGIKTDFTGTVTLYVDGEASSASVSWDTNGCANKGAFTDGGVGTDRAVYTFAAEDFGVARFNITDTTAESVNVQVKTASGIKDDDSSDPLRFVALDHFSIYHDGDGTVDIPEPFVLRAENASHGTVRFSGVITISLASPPAAGSVIGLSVVGGRGTLAALGGYRWTYAMPLSDDGVVTLAVSSDRTNTLDLEARWLSWQDDDVEPRLLRFIEAAAHYVWRTSPSPTWPYTTPNTAAHTIQEAVNAAGNGRRVIILDNYQGYEKFSVSDRTNLLIRATNRTHPPAVNRHLSGDSSGPGVHILRCKDLRLENLGVFNFDSGGGYGVLVENCSSVTLRRLSASNNTEGNMGQVTLRNTRHSAVDDCRLVGKTGSEAGHICLDNGSARNIVRNCRMTNGSKWGIRINNDTAIRSNLITRNIIHNAYQAGLTFYGNGASHHQIVSNRILYGSSWGGIRLEEVNDFQIRFNIVFRCQGNGIERAWRPGSRFVVRNNTIVSNGSTGLEFRNQNCTSATLRNNIVAHNGNKGVAISGAVLACNNIYSNNGGNFDWGGYVDGGGNIAESSRFLSRDPRSTNFLRLADTSPCIDAGWPYDPVPEGGGSRIDIGALEWTSLPPCPSVTILSFGPSVGGPGDTVTLRGTGFGPSPGRVAFQGASATPSFWSPTNITVTVPAGAQTGPLRVTNACGQYAVTSSNWRLGASLAVSTRVSNVTLAGRPLTPPVPVPGATVVLVLTVSNKAAASATNAGVVFSVPDAVTLVSNSATVPAGWTLSWSTNITDPVYTSVHPPAAKVRWVRWRKPSLGSAEKARLTVKVVIR